MSSPTHSSHANQPNAKSKRGSLSPVNITAETSEDQQRMTRFAPISPVDRSWASSVTGAEGGGGALSNFIGRFFATSSSSAAPKQPQQQPTASANEPAFVFPAADNSVAGMSSVTLEENGSWLDVSNAAEVTRKGSNAGSDVSSPSGSMQLPSPAFQGIHRPSRQSVVRKISKTGGLSSVTTKFTKVLKMTPQDHLRECTDLALMDYNRSDFRQYWMPDSRGKECYDCQEKFTTFRRRHHCRICGQIFCSKCCNSEVPGQFLGYMGDLRLCNYCCKTVVQYLENNPKSNNEDCDGVLNDAAAAARGDTATVVHHTDEPVLSLLDNTATNRPQQQSAASSQNQSDSAQRQIDNIHTISTGFVWPQTSNGSSAEKRRNAEMNDTTAQLAGKPTPSILSVTDLNSTRLAVDTGLKRTLPLLVNCTMDDYEPDWVKSISTAKGDISGPNSDVPNENMPSAVSPSSVSLDGRLALDSESANRLGVSSRTNHQTLSGSTSCNLPRQPPVSLAAAGASPDTSHSLHSAHSVSSTLGSPHSGGPIVEQSIGAMFETQAVKLLDYVLSREGLSGERWTRVLWPLCQEIAYTLQPNVRDRKDDMDVLAYLHVKTALVGSVDQPGKPSRPHAQVVFGTVCSKAVSDMRMQQRFRLPTVLVMAGAIEYERVEGRFSSIDPIIAQETEYLRGVVSRISAREPNILVVEKSVARIAKQFILQKGITLVHGLKPAVLKRISRCTQADVVQAAEAQITKPKMGTCGAFRTEKLQLLNGDIKTLMYFEDCQPDLSCSVVLYGGNYKELRAVKKVFRFMVSVLYSAKLETDLIRTSQVCLLPQEHVEDAANEEDNKTLCAVCTANYRHPLQPKSESWNYCGDALGADMPEPNAKEQITNGLSATDSVLVDDEDPSLTDVVPTTHERPTNKATNQADQHAELTNGDLTDSGELSVLSASPFTMFGLPFLETEMGRKCKLLAYFKQPLYRFNPRLLTKYLPANQKQNFEDASTPSLDRPRWFYRDELLPPNRQLDARAHTAVDQRRDVDSVLENGLHGAVSSVEPHRFVKQTTFTNIADTRRAISEYRADSGRLFRNRLVSAQAVRSAKKATASTKPTSTDGSRKRNRVPSGPIDIFSPYNHQRIAVLFGSYSPKSPNAPLFCVRPWVVWMEFYGLHDMPLGEFLKKYCFNADYRCPSPNCDVPMLDHLRKIVHRNSAIEISTQAIMEHDGFGSASEDSPIKQLRQTSEGSVDRILAWDWCVRCKTTTNAVPLSSEVWHLSFAKYLDYLLNGRHLQSHIVNTSAQDGVLESRPCAHCLFHEHDHYFVLNNYICCLKVTQAQLFEVAFSPMVCYIEPTPLIPVMPLVNDTKELSEFAGSVFNAMRDGVIKFEAHKDAAAFYSHISSTVSKTYEERKESFRKSMASVQEVMSALSPLNNKQIYRLDATFLKACDGLIRCRHVLSIAIMEWNQSVSDLAAAVKQQPSSSSSSLLHKRNASNTPALSAASLNSAVSDSQDKIKVAPPPSAASVVNAADVVANSAGDEPESMSSAAVSASSSTSRLDVVDLSSSTSTGVLPLETTTEAVFALSTAKQAPPPPAPAPPPPQPSPLKAATKGNAPLGPPPELTAIAAPFDANEHYTLPMGRIPVVVRDNEIGSIVAYGLSSKEYEAKRRQLRDNCGTDGIALSLKMSFFDSNHVSDSKSEGIKNSETDASQHQQLDSSNQHIELQFQDHVAKFYCKVYYAEHFRMLRKLLFADGEDAFIRALSRSETWHPNGGKSGASFYRTQDGRFIFKQMSRFEIQSFLKFAPNYFHYVSTAATENKLTALAKIHGVYRIGFRNQLNNSAGKLDLFVMEYLFYRKNIKQVYDLKGSLRNRMASEKDESELVLLDENLLKDLWQKQLYLHPHSKAALNMAISNDSHFLSAHGVMDYSLLVGVDDDSKELTMGIVDYMRTYTLDKRLESWVKIVAVPGAHLPTVISPEQYCSRFSEAIETYFPVAPDQWTGLGYGIPY